MSGRRIAPRPASQSEEHVAASAAASTTSSLGLGATAVEAQPTVSQAQSSAASVHSSRKKVTSACQGCQKRRVKCDGRHPCSTCVRINVECSYTPELDGRSIKRKFHEVQQDQSLLNELLVTLRDTTDENVSRIVSLIRSDAPLDDIKACVTQQLVETRLAGHERSPEFRQLQDSLSSICDSASSRARNTTQRSGLLEIQRLVDSPLHKLSASPWTTVTDDDDLISNVISAWLTWDKGWYDWIDEDLLIRDMQAGNFDCMFCSPFLVNSLLAWACPYSDFRDARSSNGDPSPLMLAFIEEARRLADAPSNAAVSLTTIQGLFILHGALAVTGQDSIGYRYMLQGMGMMADLVNSPMASKSLPDPQSTRELSRAIDRTCWGTYILSTGTLTALMKPQVMKVPRRLRPQQTATDAIEHMWKPYPISDVPIPSYRGELFWYGCDLAIIEAEVSRTLFDVSEQLPRKDLETKVLELDNNLQRMAAQIPEHLKSERGRFPACFTHQTRIQGLVLRMFLPLREPAEQATPTITQFAKSKCVEAASEIAQLCKLYIESWSASRVGVMMCHPCLISISVLLEEQNPERYGREITDLCIVLRALSRRWSLCMAMLRMIQMEARLKDWVLPPQTDKLFEEFEGSAWKQRTFKRYATLYPISSASKTIDFTSDEIDMGSFLAAMERLGLEDSDTESR